MPNRILRDGILRSHRVNILSPGAELFYRRLMSVVDDYGRYYGDPELLRSDCFPLKVDAVSTSDVVGWLSEVSQMTDKRPPLVRQYSVDGRMYVEVTDFKQRTRSPSRFPDPMTVKCQSDDGQMSASRARTSPTTPTNMTFSSEEEKMQEEKGIVPSVKAQNFTAADGDLWREYIGVFIACGLVPSEQDLIDAMQAWLSQADTDQALIVEDAKLKAKTTWHSPRYTQLPVNHLRTWRRKAIPRMLPPAEAEESKGERATRIAAERFRRYKEAKGEA